MKYKGMPHTEFKAENLQSARTVYLYVSQVTNDNNEYRPIQH
jgi:hypothetical protein